MMKVMLICVASCLLVVNSAHLINRCALAKVLHEEEIDGFEGYSLADWLCLAFVESNFNISKINENADGSFDYGIFQINSHYWCNDYLSHSENFCHVECQGKLSDLPFRPTGSQPPLLHQLRKKIVSESGGMKNWVEWRLHCAGRPLSYWMTGCHLE